jgi:hypothetical protein
VNAIHEPENVLKLIMSGERMVERKKTQQQKLIEEKLS